MKRRVGRPSRARVDEVNEASVSIQKPGRTVKSALAAKLAAKVDKAKKFKLDKKQFDGGTHHPLKTKKSEMDMAKFLLEKAKQANKLQEQARAKRLAAAKHSPVVHKREFVLPKQSSRSSRVIKPNKRFLEEDILSPSRKKKTKTEGNTSFGSPGPGADAGSSFSVDKAATPTLSQTKEMFSRTSVGLLDQPLIVAGKRDRKPSLKLQLSEEDSLLSPEKGPLLSPLAAPKLGTGLFQQSHFQKSSDKPKFGLFGSQRKHGASIVQKAKLQLNRAALNKSKAALARALKAEMKREAKIKEQASHQLAPEANTPALGK